MDRLVRLYDLPESGPAVRRLAGEGIVVRAAMPYEKTPVVEWVRREFRPEWADECDVAFARQPVGCVIATREGRVCGFACVESTCRGFFGPIGVAEALRGRGVGRALLLTALEAMRGLGYAYAVIGGGDRVAEFYRRTVGAMEIDGSTPGVYRDRLVKVKLDTGNSKLEAR